ncbi:MAG: ribosome maturation factor RimP [Actinomycetaceae bacterium]|nr:ribosome maturation factor RimP [Actinomycetaceae bacterium]MDY6082993.1 ribosome maturation factor RimP [Actinomycetaceae bacterium]
MAQSHRHDQRNSYHSKPARRVESSQKNSHIAAQQRIVEAVEPIVVQSGLFLEGIKVGRGGVRTVVRIVVDLPSGPGGVTSDQLAEVSRKISRELDEHDDIVAGAYTLEVSTPGAERELREPRHFSREQGHTISVKLKDGNQLSGTVTGFFGDSVELQEGETRSRIALEDIERARSVVRLQDELGEA